MKYIYVPVPEGRVQEVYDVLGSSAAPVPVAAAVPVREETPDPVPAVQPGRTFSWASQAVEFMITEQKRVLTVDEVYGELTALHTAHRLKREPSRTALHQTLFNLAKQGRIKRLRVGCYGPPTPHADTPFGTA